MLVSRLEGTGRIWISSCEESGSGSEGLKGMKAVVVVRRRESVGRMRWCMAVVVVPVLDPAGSELGL